MEFREKLKNTRNNREISTKELADAIFVSQEKVENWESGIELPSDEEMEAIEKYFEVEKGLLQSDKTDEGNNKKKKSRLRKISGCLFPVIGFGIYILIFLEVISGSYGLTSKMAAGSFADNPCIHTEDYDIYCCLMGDGEDAFICVYRPVKKVFFGYKVYEKDCNYREMYLENGDFVGVLYSFEDEDSYNNIYLSYLYPVNVPLHDKIISDGKEYDVEYNSYFATEEKPQSLVIGETKIIIDSVEKNINDRKNSD